MAVQKPQKKKPNTEFIICCVCGKANRDHYVSRHDEIDKKFGKMPICKNCISDFYFALYKEYNNHEKSCEHMCKVLNIPFENKILDEAKNRLKNADIPIYSSYINILNSKAGVKYGLYYSDSTKFTQEVKIKSKAINTSDEPDEELLYLWGEGYTKQDYKFLQRTFDEWLETASCESKSEEILLREICIKQLELRKARERGEPHKDQPIKELQDLMKTAGIDPSKINSIKANKTSAETYGTFIKMIEEEEPAEYHDNLEKYKDMDNLTYIINYIIRAIKNFMTGSRDFNIMNEDVDSENA